MEDGVGVAAMMEAVEYGPRDVAHAFGDDPGHGGGRHTRQQRFESHEHGEAHAHEASGFDVAVLLEPDKAHHRAGDGAKPHKAEKTPSPEAVFAQGDERERTIGASDVPIDGGVVKTAPQVFGAGPAAGEEALGQRMIDGGRDVGEEHAHQIEYDGRGRPSVAAAETPHQKDDAHHHAQRYAGAVGGGIEDFFASGVTNGHGVGG